VDVEAMERALAAVRLAIASFGASPRQEETKPAAVEPTPSPWARHEPAPAAEAPIGAVDAAPIEPEPAFEAVESRPAEAEPPLEAVEPREFVRAWWGIAPPVTNPILTAMVSAPEVAESTPTAESAPATSEYAPRFAEPPAMPAPAAAEAAPAAEKYTPSFADYEPPAMPASAAAEAAPAAEKYTPSFAEYQPKAAPAPAAVEPPPVATTSAAPAEEAPPPPASPSKMADIASRWGAVLKRPAPAGSDGEERKAA